MKTCILFLALMCTGVISAIGMGYYYEHEFHRITSLSWDEFNEHSVMCEELYGEPCGIYGGFAPKAQINIQKL